MGHERLGGLPESQTWKTIANKLRILCKSEEHSTDGRHRTTCAEKRWNSIETVKTVLSAFIQLSQAYSHLDFDNGTGKLKPDNSNYRAVSHKIQQFFYLPFLATRRHGSDSGFFITAPFSKMAIYAGFPANPG